MNAERDIVKMMFGCATDKGIVRAKNQDRIICHAAHTEQGTVVVACICDGIGSYEYSELASEMVTKGITLWFESVKDGRLGALSEKELAGDLDETIQELNELVWERRQKEQIRLGCTMSALLLVEDHYYIFHVGDSRIYLAGDALEQMTHDEVTFSEKDGVIKAKLANCIGKTEKLWMNRLVGKMSAGNAFILGSDGLFRKLDADEICEKIQKIRTMNQAQRQCEELIWTVERMGERDNVSCAIVKLG